MTPTKLPFGRTKWPGPEACRRWLTPTVPLLIVLLAAALRLYRLDYAQYRGDDEAIVSLAFQTLHSGGLPLHGWPSSLGVDNGPVAVYLLLLPLALGADEIGATAFIAILNILAVALTYLFVRSFFGRRTALVTTLLFAVNPWAVVYSRRAWLNAGLPLFSLLFMWSLLSAWKSVACGRAGSRPTAVASQVMQGITLGISLSAVAQVHLSGIVHLATAGVAVVAGRMWRAPRMLLAAVVTFAATFAPYLLTTVVPGLSRVLASLSASQDLSGRGGLTGSSPLVVVDWGRIQQFFYLLTNRGYQSYAGQSGSILDTTQGFFVLIDALVLLAFVPGTLVTLRRAAQRSEPGRVAHLLLLVWVALPMFFLAPPVKVGAFLAAFPFYYLVALPGLFILIAIGLETGAAVIHSAVARLWPAATSALTVGGITYALSGLIVATQLVAAVVFFTVLDEYWLKADYGLPLGHTLALARLVVQQAGTDQVLVGGHDDAAKVIYRVLQRRGIEARFFEDRNLLPTLPGAGPVWYLTTSDTAWATRFLSDHLVFYEQSHYTVAGDGWTARLFRLEASDLLTAAGLPAEREPLGRILDLAEVQAAELSGSAQAGGAIQVRVQWRFLREPDQPYMTRLFLRDAEGRSRFIHEEVAYPAAYWRTGDSAVLVFLNRFWVPIPPDTQPGDYDLTLGLVSIADWQPTGQAIVLGQLRVESSQ